MALSSLVSFLGSFLLIKSLNILLSANVPYVYELISINLFEKLIIFVIFIVLNMMISLTLFKTRFNRSTTALFKEVSRA